MSVYGELVPMVEYSTQLPSKARESILLVLTYET